mmetsp:Transcript_8035/g.12306  ORF Transcript_8035/g.12306 Transcript_8035/m.12306 type:complete len:215 (-) Transcript_8035:301-945(-)
MQHEARDFHSEEIPEPGGQPYRPHPGRGHRAGASYGEVRPQQGVQVQYLCRLVDPAGGDKVPGVPLAHHPPPRARAQPALHRAEVPGEEDGGDGAPAHGPGGGQPGGHAGGPPAEVPGRFEVCALDGDAHPGRQEGQLPPARTRRQDPRPALCLCLAGGGEDPAAEPDREDGGPAAGRRKARRAPALRTGRWAPEVGAGGGRLLPHVEGVGAEV